MLKAGISLPKLSGCFLTPLSVVSLAFGDSSSRPKTSQVSCQSLQLVLRGEE